MRKYVVTVTGHFMKTLLIDAENAEGAIRSVFDGNGTVIYQEEDTEDFEVTEETI